MSAKSVLITQCLQNDFVKPISKYDPLPNLLHVGVDEAKRMMGEIPEEGPVAMTMKWAYEQSDSELSIVHIRDWHSKADQSQVQHLEQFGDHCIGGTEGAKFAFPTVEGHRPVHIVDSPGLNDFLGTTLADVLAPYEGESVKVGLMGVWTEAKVSFLAYDLRTRFPHMDIAVCSALTASSSRAQHFISLEQLQRILGVKILSSIGEFTNFLGGSSLEIDLPQPKQEGLPRIVSEGEDKLQEADTKIIRYLFRDCQEVHLRPLAGGYSGNVVLGCQSKDLMGHTQVSHVVKIGEEGPIGQERTSFEKIEDVLGNNAPSITGFADYGGRGAIKYRYAAMGGGFSSTLQKLYENDLPIEKMQAYLTTVFKEQMGRLYSAATLEYNNLMEYYWFSPDRAPGVRRNVEKVLGAPPEGETLKLSNGAEFPNPCLFYENELADIIPRTQRSTFFSYIHGDLNGANIIVDAQDNVWIIDFFFTHHGHILKDLIKFENDLIYIFTPVENHEDLQAGIDLTNFLYDSVQDLRKPLPELSETPITHPGMQRAYETIRMLRSFYPDLISHDRDPLQLMIGLLRYSAHTLIFVESNQLQKEWALYNTGKLGKEIARRLKQRGPLRVDWIDKKHTGNGRLGVTLLPGRRDHGRNLQDDIAQLKKDGVSRILTLITDNELDRYGVPDLFQAYSAAGIEVMRMPILDQAVSSTDEMRSTAKWLSEQLGNGESVMVHCVGGLGRAGLVAASYLKSSGLSAEDAISEIRRVRTVRALESHIQEEFVREF